MRFGHAGPNWKVWLDDVEVTKDCFEANVTQGYIDRFARNEDGRPYVCPEGKNHARSVRSFGTVRISHVRSTPTSA